MFPECDIFVVSVVLVNSLIVSLSRFSFFICCFIFLSGFEPK